jgi:hypothetical protein
VKDVIDFGINVRREGSFGFSEDDLPFEIMEEEVEILDFAFLQRIRTDELVAFRRRFYEGEDAEVNQPPVFSLPVDEVFEVSLVLPAVEILVFRYYALAICTSKFTRVMVR